MKHPKASSKHQAPNTRKAPSSKFQAGSAGRGLELGTWDFFGVWNLVFGVWSLNRRLRRCGLSSGLVSVSLVLAVLCVADLQARQCVVCDIGISGDCYLITDRVTGLEQVICEGCVLLKTRCYLCGMPVKNDLMTLGDGRFLCARDSKNVVLSDDEAQRDCADARDELVRLFSRFTTFPKTNVTVVMVDRTQMDQLMQTPGFDRQCPSVNGYIRSRVVAGGEWKHPINILNGLPKYRLMAVCAHEFGHAWVRENLPPSRDIDRDSEEGFCELVAYKLMERLNQQAQMDAIRNNLYTRGQFDLLLEADTTYGFYTVVQWMKCGTDNCLRSEEPDRIRKIDERRLLKPRRESPAVPLVFVPNRGKCVWERRM